LARSLPCLYPLFNLKVNLVKEKLDSSFQRQNKQFKPEKSTEKKGRGFAMGGGKRGQNGSYLDKLI